jgi:L-asparaginase
MLGDMEFDAAVMCGSTLRTGAVGALQGYRHAVSVARQVMERTAHVFLVGEGAARFAAEIGEVKGDVLYPQSRAEYDAWIAANLSAGERARLAELPLAPLTWRSTDPEKPKGTTTWLVRTAEGRTAGGTSTCGWRYKYPGRLGDSPVIGAGLYVDDRFGGAMCTHTGEMAIRAGTARSVVLYMKKGATVQAACHEAVDDLRALRGGCLGPLVVHAMDRDGMPCVVSTIAGASYWYWEAGAPAAERRPAEFVEL